MANNNPPRRIDIKGQDHMLAYITPEEGGILQLLGGAGKPGPMGIPSYYEGMDSVSTVGDDPSTPGDPGVGTTSNSMGVDDDVATMMGITAGATRGMVGPDIAALNKRSMIDPMTGKRSTFNPAVATHTDLFGRKDMANAIYGAAAQSQGIAGMRGDDLGFTASALGFSPGTLGPDGTMTGNPYGPGMMTANQVSLMSPLGAMMGLARGLGLVDKTTRGVTTTTPVDFYDTMTKGINYGQVPWPTMQQVSYNLGAEYGGS